MTKHAVLILHGYNSSPLYTKSIETILKNTGKFDQVINLTAYDSLWGLFSRNYNIATPILNVTEKRMTIRNTIVEYVYQQIKRNLNKEIRFIHLIGHSMGGLVWRALIKSIIMKKREDWLWDANSPKVGCVIQLATPNNGSQLTNLGIIGFIENLLNIIYLRSSNYPRRFANAISKNFESQERNRSSQDQQSMQITQMRPGSKFLYWLNSDPTYTDVIPHYILIGTKNSLIFTNLAWINETSQNMSIEEFVEKIKHHKVSDEITDLLNVLENSNVDPSEEIHEVIEQLNLEEEVKNLINTGGKGKISPQFLKMFDNSQFEPNDGLVSLSDASLDGGKMVDMSPYSNQITHFGIGLWFLPFEQYQYVKNKVIEILDREMDKINDALDEN